MIPIYDEFPQKEISEREKHFQEEVLAFMECDCKMAYVDIDETVTMSRNRDVYKRVLRRMRIQNVKIKQRNNKIYLTKMEKANG